MSIADQLESLMSGQQGELQPGNRAQITLAKVTNITDDKKFNRVKCLPIGAALLAGCAEGWLKRRAK